MTSINYKIAFMKKFIYTYILLFFFFSLSGQNKPDSIVVKKAFGTVFQQNGRNLNPRQLLDITQVNQEAFSEMKIAKRNSDLSNVLGFPGAFMLGWQLGTASAGGEANWSLAGIGAGLMIISIPFTIAFTKHAKNAVHFFNDGLNYSYFTKPDLKIGMARNGIGIQLNF